MIHVSYVRFFSFSPPFVTPSTHKRKDYRDDARKGVARISARVTGSSIKDLGIQDPVERDVVELLEQGRFFSAAKTLGRTTSVREPSLINIIVPINHLFADGMMSDSGQDRARSLRHSFVCFGSIFTALRATDQAWCSVAPKPFEVIAQMERECPANAHTQPSLHFRSSASFLTPRFRRDQLHLTNHTYILYDSCLVLSCLVFQ